MSQIKDGKQMHQVLEAHFILYLMLYKLDIISLLQRYPNVRENLKEEIIIATFNLNKCQQEPVGNIKRNNSNILTYLNSIHYFDLQHEFDHQLNNQPSFIEATCLCLKSFNCLSVLHSNKIKPSFRSTL